VSLLAVLVLVAAACGGGGGGGDGGGGGTGFIEGSTGLDNGQPQRGGILKMAGVEDFDYLDPAAQYFTLTNTMLRGVVRTLVAYPTTTDDAEAGQLVPDLATDTGKITNNSTRFEFQLKDGIKYGPALGGQNIPGVTGKEITSHDIEYAVERIFMGSVGNQYPFYYTLIEGAQEFQDGKAKDISGIETPDDKTIIFNLTEPAGDFGARMSLTATAPVPERYAKQFDKEKTSDYDDHVVASGPYFIKSYREGEQLTIRRNPHWDEATDDLRPSYIDGIDWKIGFESEVATQKVLDGEYGYAIDAAPTGPLLEKLYTQHKNLLLVADTSCTRYLFMNTNTPPFDDVKVRQAVAYGIDRENIRRIYGGPVKGDIATSIIPPTMPAFLATEEFNPYPSENLSGDMDRAKQLLAEAGYENGVDVPVTIVGSSTAPYDKLTESVRQDLANMGFKKLNVKSPSYPNQYTQFYSVVAKEVQFGTAAGWCQDYPDAFTFFDPLFNGDNISPTGNNNYSMLDDPAINRKIDQVAAIPAGEERVQGWEELNRMVMEEAVWVPWLWDKTNELRSEDVGGVIFNDFLGAADPYAMWVNQG